MRYAILNENRVIVNIIAVEPEQANAFDAHYLGDVVLRIGDTYPETDFPLPEPEHEPTETEILQAQVADLQNQIITMMTGG